MASSINPVHLHPDTGNVGTENTSCVIVCHKALDTSRIKHRFGDHGFRRKPEGPNRDQLSQRCVVAFASVFLFRILLSHGNDDTVGYPH
jgi:hypothetical protein